MEEKRENKKFSRSDFMNPETALRLRMVCMELCDKPASTTFLSLKPYEQKKFNRILNEYIGSLGEDWEKTLIGDFNRVCTEHIFDKDFDPEKHYIRELNTDIQYLSKEDMFV
jgi:hypothetical protein